MNIDPNLLGSEEKQEQYRDIFNAAFDGVIILDVETGLMVEANPAACRMHGYTREEIVGLKLMTIIHPDNQKVFKEHIRTFPSSSFFDTRALHVRKDGTTFYAEWRGSIIAFHDRPCMLGVVRDVTRHIQSEQQLHRREKLHNYEQAKLFGIMNTITSTLEFQSSLIIDHLKEIVEFKNGVLFAVDGSALVTLAMYGTPLLEQSPQVRIRLNSPETMATLFKGQRPICIADVWGDNPQAQFLRSFLNDGAAGLIEGMRSWMWIPLAVRGLIIGCVGIAEAKKNYFTTHHANLALNIANQAAIAMYNADLYKHAQSLAILEERQRLARDLHDAINQSLFSAGLIAEVLPRLWERDQQEARRSIEDLRRLTRGAQAEMRALLAELRPTTLTDTELSDLLLLLGNAFSGRTNIPVFENVSGIGSVPAETQIALYRICQEALNNIAKHAKASRVEIDMHHAPDKLDIHIRDNGCGFDVSLPAPSGHYGLEMLRERAEAIGAILKVTSQPGQGTEVSIYWCEKEV
jgi:PAS domain S-box-containing protein